MSPFGGSMNYPCRMKNQKKLFYILSRTRYSIITFALRGRGIHRNANVYEPGGEGNSSQCERSPVIFFNWAPTP